jgi:hypothetical protein
MKFLLVSVDPGEILPTAARYFNEKLSVPAVKVSAIKLPEYIPAADAAIDVHFLRHAVKKAEANFKIIMAQDTLWLDVATLDESLKEVSKSQTKRTLDAHNLIVMEQLLEVDLAYWDMIFFRPVPGALYNQTLEKLANQFLHVITLADDETVATDELVYEISGFLGLDDE